MRKKNQSVVYDIGVYGEDVANRYLEDRGFFVLERNFRGRRGEVDIIARDPGGEYLVFVEVKTTAAALKFSLAELRDRIQPYKMERFALTARYYLFTHPDLAKELHPRFDACFVIVTRDGSDGLGPPKKASVIYLPDAF